MTDPQPTATVGSEKIFKMDIDVNNKPVVTSLSPDVSPPSSAAAVKSALDKNGSSSSALKNGPPPTDDKLASTATGNTHTLSQNNNNNGGSEKEKGSTPKPKIKIKLSAKKPSSSNDGKKKSSSTSTTTTTKPSLKKTSSSSNSPGSYSGVGGGGGMQRSKAYQGNLRSAAAAHRKDKVAIPPIGSPGLLMMPNPALTANFPKDIQTPEELKQWLYNGHYLLPATVFRRAMEVGGYTVQQRKEHPHRGSSTERQVGDMFDSDVGGLYLHFPELIPRRVWERRLGGELDDYTNDDEDYMDDFPVRDRRKRRRKSSSSKRRGSHSSDSNTKSDGGSNSKSKDHHSGVKGARSSYIFFTHEMRPKMMQEFPGMKFTEQGIIMGERWRALTPEQKKPYEDLANEDKKRYATEWAAYLETVKKEIREEKEGGKKKEDDGETTKEEVEDDDEEEEDEDDEGEEDKPVVVKLATVRKKGNEAAIKGPRLVDAVILSLCNILGEKAYRTEPLPPMPQKKKESLPTAAAVAHDSKPVAAASVEAPTPNADIVSTADASKSDQKPVVVPEQSKSDPNVVEPANPDPITSSGSNVVAATDGTKETISHPVKDLALEELPKLNPTLPQTRKRCRPHEPMSFLDMIPTSLTCTYPQEYVAKRRAYAEAVRAREEAIIASQEAKDDADDAREKYLAHTEAWDRMLEYQKQQIAKRAAERKRQKARKEAEENKNGDKDSGDAETGNDASKEVVEKEEDPMDCMPPRPKSPPPARVVSIPDIPTPPSPPQLFEIDSDDMDTDNNTTSIRVPKKKTELLQHLDPKCFIPNMDGRYFGLISNSIADPQFVGPTSTGIRGTTFGGGTGLATSYVGGGRGASGLVSGPSRSSVGSRVSSTVLAMEEDEKKTSASSSDGASTKVSSKKKKRPASSPPSSSSSSKKRDKKETKKLCLATGDRITSATEVSSGPAGPEFPSGWVIKTYRRSGGETIGKTDRFWFSPGRNIRFRAKKHARQFIDILNEPSINGDEDAAAEAYKKRGLHF